MKFNRLVSMSLASSISWLAGATNAAVVARRSDIPATNPGTTSVHQLGEMAARAARFDARQRYFDIGEIQASFRARYSVESTIRWCFSGRDGEARAG